MLEAIGGLRRLRPWQAAVLVAVLALGIGGSYSAYHFATRTDEGIDEDQQLYSVSAGDLVSEVSISGSLVFPNREKLSFGVHGRVGQVLVGEGEAVSKGQPLSALDEESMATLEKAVAQAEVDLRDAQDALDSARTPYTALDVAQAEADAANAEADLRSAEEELAELTEPSAHVLAEAGAEAADAEVALRSAEEGLAELTKPSAHALAEAEAKAANAEAALKSAEEELAELTEPSARALAEAEAKAASAKFSAAEAADALEALIGPPSEQEAARAETNVKEERIAVARASEALEDLLDGPGEDAAAKARSEIDSAQAALTVAQLDLTLTRDDWTGKLDEAADTLEESQELYADVFLRWLGIELTETEQLIDADALLESWNADLASLFMSRISVELPLDDPATRWNELTVHIWASFFPGEVVVRCGSGAVLDHDELCIRGEMDDAWEAVDHAADKLSMLRTQAAKDISNAESAVARAEEKLAEAEGALADLLAELDPLDIEEKRTSLEAARSSLQEAEEKLAELKGGPDALEVANKRKELALASADLAQAEEELAKLKGEPDALEVANKRKELALASADLTQAEEELAKLKGEPDALEVANKEKELALASADLTQAEGELAELLAGPDPIDVNAARKKIELARAKLADARGALAEVLAGADPITVALREADVAASSAALASARGRLEQAALTAPWAGVISTIDVEPGQQIAADAAAFEIVDESIIEVDGVVDEIDVLFVREDAIASVTMDALPGQVLSGVVSDIATAGGGGQQSISQQGFITGIVRYRISIRVDVPPGLSLPEGLSAIASVAISEDRGVLLVPLDAVYGSFEQPVLRVMSDGDVEDRAVSLGNSDDFWVVVESGIAEGDVVVMQYRQADEGFGFPGGGFRRIVR